MREVPAGPARRRPRQRHAQTAAHRIIPYRQLTHQLRRPITKGFNETTTTFHSTRGGRRSGLPSTGIRAPPQGPPRQLSPRTDPATGPSHQSSGHHFDRLTAARDPISITFQSRWYRLQRPLSAAPTCRSQYAPWVPVHLSTPRIAQHVVLDDDSDQRSF